MKNLFLTCFLQTKNNNSLVEVIPFFALKALKGLCPTKVAEKD